MNLLRNRQPRIPAPAGYYGCTKCEQIKPDADFARRQDGSGRPNSWCRLCKNAHELARRRAIGSLPAADVAEMFWPKVNKEGPNGCWLFTGHVGPHGYGQFWQGGKLKRAHRTAWELAGNEVPEWPMVLDHICKVKNCVRPEHLRAVRQAENCVELANDNPWKTNKARKDCKWGHPFTPENIRRSKAGHRECKECIRLRGAGKHPSALLG